ncbi:hypothetical protein QVD17_02766 [Tagetes erecta]|uniref:Uncharacterized protein n=1 Tax=Tagetes erecta TaxID=13708 RepID=A0AAD8P9C7_TARER|nr:hypothetical protein QVD17_02766 [Tagetes erecta]
MGTWGSSVHVNLIGYGLHTILLDIDIGLRKFIPTRSMMKCLFEIISVLQSADQMFDEMPRQLEIGCWKRMDLSVMMLMLLCFSTHLKAQEDQQYIEIPSDSISMLDICPSPCIGEQCWLKRARALRTAT